jgi:hypothetical protein
MVLGDWTLKEKLPETKNRAFLMFSTEAYLAAFKGCDPRLHRRKVMFRE